MVGVKERKLGLKDMLMGVPLHVKDPERERARMVNCINSHLIAIADLIPRVYGETDASHQAVLEVGTVVDMGDSKECMACKRAMLLYALFNEASVLEHWKQSSDAESAEMAEDMASRVLPFLFPRFFRNCCQAPDLFVTTALIMCSMWKGERLGNFPCKGAP